MMSPLSLVKVPDVFVQVFVDDLDEFDARLAHDALHHDAAITVHGVKLLMSREAVARLAEAATDLSNRLASADAEGGAA